MRYLPKYSPDLNPIELPYSKFKAFLRKVAARTVPRLTRAIRSFIPQLTPHECANYFRHAGYASKGPESALVTYSPDRLWCIVGRARVYDSAPSTPRVA